MNTSASWLPPTFITRGSFIESPSSKQPQKGLFDETEKKKRKD